MGEAVDFRVLGSLDLRHDGEAVDLGTAKQRTILALLLLHSGHPVPVPRMVDELWPGGAPPSAVANVTTYVSRLRRILRGVGCALTRRDNAYLLETPAESVDLHRFTALTGQAEKTWQAGDVAGSACLWASALAIWRGAPFESVATGPDLEAAAAAWQERRLTAIENQARARLRLGDASDLVASLLAHTRAEPLRESGWLLLMAALRMTGNSAVALQAYEQSRLTLAERLGTDPGHGLRALHQAILTEDNNAFAAIIEEHSVAVARPPAEPAQLAPSAVGPPTVSQGRAPTPPAQLPVDVQGFVGRADELAELDQLAETAIALENVVIAGLSGPAGVGKTALAVHWARRAAHRFPDGQLYLNLRGYGPQESPIPADEALWSLLDGLGVAATQLPSGLDARTVLFRSVMAGRRMLVVLDNALDAAHVRPLLPAAPGCLVLVSSRNSLAGLVAVEGAKALSLEVFDRDGSRSLLAGRLGANRLTHEPAAVDEIIHRCAGLPLALAIIAARVATRPGLSLADQAADLEDEDRLDVLSSTGDPCVDVRSVFSWSVRALSPDAARLFRLLGRHPYPELSAAAAASLVGLSPARTRPLLGELTRAYLVSEPARNRYALHDLLHEYAGQLPLDEPSGTATRRMLDHYLHTARTADRLLDRARVPAPLVGAPADVTVEALTDDAGARSWFGAARPALIAAVDLAGRAGFDPYAWQLADAMATFLYRQGMWDDQVTVQRRALQAATRAADASAQGSAQVHLARAHIRLREHGAAEAHLRAALALYRNNADPEGQARTHHYLGLLHEQQGRYRDGLDHSRQAVAICRARGLRFGLGHALNALSWCHAQLGNHDDALAHGREAVEVSRNLGDLAGQANALDTLGYAHHRLGNDEAAVISFRRAIDLYRGLEDRYYESVALTHLAERHHAAARTEGAREAYRQALAALEEIHHPGAEQVRAELLLLEGREPAC